MQAIDEREGTAPPPLLPPLRRPALPPARTAVGALTTAAALAAVLLLPRLVGTTWHDVRGAVGHLGAVDVLGLLVLWVAGLCCCSKVLTASLPGLTSGRALLLNLTGSAVAGAVPLGGALGMWLNTSMLRRWSFRGRDIASFTVTSNVVDVVGKLLFVLPVLVAALAAGGLPQVPGATGWALALAATMVVMAAGTLLAGTDRGLDRLAALTAAAAALAARLRRRPGRAEVAARTRGRLLDVRTAVGERLRSAWRPLMTAVLAYVGLQALLAVLCLHLAGVRLPVVTLLAAFAVDRVVSAVPITPSGAGFAEAAACAVLVGAGGDPRHVLAGVLLYRLFLVVLEVPVGGVLLGGWLLAGRAVPARTASALAVARGGLR
ncbi:lysylphosphatidylglycerol synthase domain-containing protein [Kineococcus rubinsiae]|uniref:lysylphosphatidylglycerol synthase domain-containing protein n=1 Tax=Kineococcus rubinsiae TaxID=2609562 RepID=UPI00142FB90F|nr:lysylphosphatidylglycerol synthase domain-containing protein [Kineococcus rubinsiae]